MKPQDARRCTRGYASEGNKANSRALSSSRSPGAESREGRLLRGLVLTVWGNWARAGGHYGSEASLGRDFSRRSNSVGAARLAAEVSELSGRANLLFT
jgi:hypothetical protein